MPTWVSLVVSLVTGLIPLATQVAKAWQSSAGFPAIADIIAKSPMLADLEKAGAEMFPAAAQKIQAVLAAIHLGVPDATKWIQRSLNAIQSMGQINFGPALVVDGKFGPKTFAAVTTLQTKFGLPVTGAVAELEYNVINGLVG